MNDTAILITALCVSPLITAALCWIFRALELNAREQDTRRYPRYGGPADRPDNKPP